MADCKYCKKSDPKELEGDFLCISLGSIVVGFYELAIKHTEYGCLDGQIGMCPRRDPKH